MDWFDQILYPIKVVVAYIMYGFHSLATTLGLDPASGAAWAISIVGLVIVIRILLIPLFVRQIKAQRGLQLISPELQAIQKKYKGKSDPASREAMSRETMELYRKHGTNPFASCLPILAQSPIFFALFRVLYKLPDVAAGNYPSQGAGGSIGPITPEVADQVSNATIFGAPISSTFLSADATMNTRIVTVVLIIAMSVTTFTTQKQLTQKNMPASALQGPMAQQQKMLLYLLPLIFAISGVNFPIGVLIYWTTTNLWTMGQQFYVIRRNPTPGSEAERQLKERRAKKAAAKGIVLEEETPKPAIEEAPRGQRQQPKRKPRAKRPAPGTPAEKSSHDSGAAASEGPSGEAATKPAPGTSGGSAARTTKPRSGSGGTAGTAKGSTPRAGTAKAGTPKAGASGTGTQKAGAARSSAAKSGGSGTAARTGTAKTGTAKTGTAKTGGAAASGTPAGKAGSAGSAKASPAGEAETSTSSTSSSSASGTAKRAPRAKRPASGSTRKPSTPPAEAGDETTPPDEPGTGA